MLGVLPSPYFPLFFYLPSLWEPTTTSKPCLPCQALGVTIPTTLPTIPTILLTISTISPDVVGRYGSFYGTLDLMFLT